MSECLYCGYISRPRDEYIYMSQLECPHCGTAYGELPEKPEKEITPKIYWNKLQERKQLPIRNEVTIKKEVKQLTTGQAWLLIIVSLVGLTIGLAYIYNSKMAKHEMAKQNSPKIDYILKYRPLSLPPDMQKEIDMRRDIYEEARRGTQDALFEHDISRSRDFPLTLSQPLPNLNRGLDINDPLTRMEMEDIAKRQAERAVENDRILHGRPPF